MNAARLLAAAEQMRIDHRPPDGETAWLAVADWLTIMAETYAPYWAEPYAAPFVPVIERAYAVADAYLGDPS